MLGRLPGRKSRITARPERPVRIWTDAAYEPDDVHSAAMGFVAFLPGRDSLPDRWIHGSTVVPRAFVVTHFGHFTQYIGQLEMLAAVAVYASLDPADLRGRRVIHWIDNTAASDQQCVSGRFNAHHKSRRFGDTDDRGFD